MHRPALSSFRRQCLARRVLHCAAAGALALPVLVQAATLNPVSYDMPNGYGQANSGSFNYWDKDYTGAGNTTVDHAPLSGGLGDLTDGVIATDNWIDTENVAGTGPYVGWVNLDPVIHFHFGAAHEFQSLTIHHDDADGLGNVATPTGFRVTVGGNSQLFNISDPAGAGPVATTLNLAGLGWVGSSLSLEVIRRDTSVMLSEVSFQGVSAVPEPGTWALMVAGLGALGWRRRAGPVSSGRLDPRPCA